MINSEGSSKMMGPRKRQIAEVPPGAASPLEFAVAKRDQATLDMVRDAVAHNQTLLAYQPIMLSSAPDRVGFYEGLIRIADPTGRIIPARDFMPAVEETELGRDIDTLALRAGLRTLHQHPSLRLSLNMSARSVGYQPWNATLKHWLNKDATIGERLILEITENSAIVVPDLVLNFMNRLQNQGICFALDDFGAGYTALRYFKDFYFDVLKIDGQFVRGIAGDPDNQALVAAMVSIAQHFDMLTVAEFVENQPDASKLIELGVDCLQGYYFAAPTVSPAWLHKPGMKATG